MPSLQTLVGIAGFGGIIIGCSGYVFGYKYQERLRKTVTYQRILEILLNHEKTVKHLGEPIKEGRIKFLPKNGNIRKFTVPLTGSNTKGILDCEVELTESDLKPEISKLEIKFANIPNKIFVVYNNQ